MWLSGDNYFKGGFKYTVVIALKRRVQICVQNNFKLFLGVNCCKEGAAPAPRPRDLNLI